jgi:hypothetical protein
MGTFEYVVTCATPHAPPVPACATKRSRTVTLPPPTKREIEASALRKSRRALAMRETAAALSLEAFYDVIVVDARIVPGSAGRSLKF